MNRNVKQNWSQYQFLVNAAHWALCHLSQAFESCCLARFFTHFYNPPVVHLFLQIDSKDSLIYRHNFTANAVKFVCFSLIPKWWRERKRRRETRPFCLVWLYVFFVTLLAFFPFIGLEKSAFLFHYTELKKVNKIFWGRNYCKINSYSKLLNTPRERKRAHLFCRLEEHTFCEGTFNIANHFSEFYIKSYTEKLLENSHFVVSFLSRLLPQDLSLEMLLIFMPASYIFSSCLHKRVIWTHIFIFCGRKKKIFYITIKWLASVRKGTILFFCLRTVCTEILGRILS